MASRSKTDAFSSMWSVAVPCLDGARAASVVDLADEDILRVHLLVLLAQVALDLQPAPVASALVVADLEEEVAASVVAEVVASEVIEEVVLEVTVEASVVDLEALLEVEVATVVEEVVSDTRTDMLLPKVLLLVHEEVDEEEEAVSAAEVEDDMETTGHHVVVVVVATEIGTWAPVAPTTNPSDVIALQNVVVAVVVIEEAATVEATEVVTKTAVTAVTAMVGMVAETTATARENVLMRANTTTGARDEGTKLRRLRGVCEWVLGLSQRLPSISSPCPSNPSHR
jgi:hypothetical protein